MSRVYAAPPVIDYAALHITTPLSFSANACSMCAMQGHIPQLTPIRLHVAHATKQDSYCA